MKIKYDKRKIIKITFLLLTFCFLIFTIVLLLIKAKTNQIILINIFGIFLTEVSLYYILGLILIIWFIVGLNFLWKKSNSKLSKIFVFFGYCIVIISILIGLAGYILNSSVSTYHEFLSVNKKYKLIAKEHSFLLLSNISLYERKNIFFINEIKGATILPDDGFTPISQNRYWIKWNANVVQLAMDNNDSDKHWDLITIKFENNKYEVNISTYKISD